MKQHQNHFDVIIVDASDPVGPADVLFEKPFYMAMKNALRAGGIVATQGENMWLHLRFRFFALRCRVAVFLKLWRGVCCVQFDQQRAAILSRRRIYSNINTPTLFEFVC